MPFGASGRIAASIKGPPSLVGIGESSQGLSGALTSLLSISSGSGSPPSIAPISSLSALRQAISGLANYDGLTAGFSGQAKRPVYRNLSLLITGRARLSFVVGG